MKKFLSIVLYWIIIIILIIVILILYQRERGMKQIDKVYTIDSSFLSSSGLNSIVTLHHPDHPRYPFIQTILPSKLPSTSTTSLNTNYYIPRIIWTYWHTNTLPDFVNFNLDRWKRILGSEYEIRLLNEDTLKQYISSNAIPSNLKTDYSKQHQSDWIRCYLLKTYGGIWADSGILFNSLKAFNYIYDTATSYQVDYAGFNIAKFQVLADFPVIENWFIMVPQPNNLSSSSSISLSSLFKPSLMELWFEEFDQAIRMGFVNYKDYAEKKLKVNSQKIFETKSCIYLTCHLCMQTVLQYRLKSNPPRLFLQCAEDTMFYIHSTMRWNLLNIGYAVQTPQALKLDYIKLRNCDRMFINSEKIKKIYS